jgi:hypothetical protein
MLCSTGRFLAKTVGVRPAEWQRVRSERGVKKKFIFFLRSFPERMFREVCGEFSVSSTLRGINNRKNEKI